MQQNKKLYGKLKCITPGTCYSSVIQVQPNLLYYRVSGYINNKYNEISCIVSKSYISMTNNDHQPNL